MPEKATSDPLLVEGMRHAADEDENAGHGLQARYLREGADEIERLRKMHELDRHAVNRWVPCADHRDKMTSGLCYVCENERLRGLLKRAGHPVEDGRAFS
jgi:hypothetical protein